MEWFHNVVLSLSDFVWTYILIAVLIVLGVYFSVRTRFVQVVAIRETLRLLVEKEPSDSSTKGEKKGVSSFQAFCISTASRVGTGNLAGVAIAISLGGPGAVFWMWVIAIFGAASGFVESTLAQIFKVRDGNNFRGGPAYYMEKALNARWLGIIFALLITFSFGFVFNAVQVNTMTSAFQGSFGWEPLWIGIVLAVMLALTIFGGVQRIGQVSSVIVPVMATGYILIALFVIVMNISAIPQVFSDIFMHAFGFREAASGGIGAAMMMGIKRGLFSNEAGMGSAPNAAATANVSHPVKQGMIQSLGVFVDTLLVCSATAFIILFSGLHASGDYDGIQLTQQALASQVGDWANIFVGLAIFLFAFSSLIGNYYYGQSNIEFINGKGRHIKMWMLLYRLGVIAMVIFGSVAKVALVWDMADLFMGCMALINLVVITLLGKYAFAALQDYRRQRQSGVDPQFHASTIPGLKHADCWVKE
ncbi:alanine/glycine:cation symporter family protein [Paenibacillus selenitireducens]|uniref:alanine/glycine:cation symporter family protein n=1 Tax=Paenibacillus selenitireducens TaxID=1324314 RepID=UPI00117FCAFA|nr:alanine/glycine:cation symporter family protein [Paenibacillus selenitireducens]